MSLFVKTKSQNKFFRQESLPGNIVLFFLKHKKETPRCICCSGAFTLEATIILPLVICFFISILFFFRVIQVQLEVQKSLDDTGRKLAVCLSGDKDYSQGAKLALATGVFLKEAAGRKEVEQYVKGGMLGISLMGSEMTGEEISLNAAYQMVFPVKLFWDWKLNIVQSAQCRKWTGWKPIQGNEEGDIWVYITETGTVYHTSRTCTHLDLSIHWISYQDLLKKHNKYDVKYRECIIYADKANAFQGVYITEQGDCYHTDLNCSGLKRTIRMIRLSEAEGRSKCSKCQITNNAEGEHAK